MLGKKHFFWTGFISLFTNFLSNSHQYFHHLLQVLMIQYKVLTVSLFHEFLWNHIAYILYRVPILHSFFFMCLVWCAYLFLGHVYLVSSLPFMIWITYHKNIILFQFHFILKVQKDQVIKGTYLAVNSMCYYEKRQKLLCLTLLSSS